MLAGKRDSLVTRAGATMAADMFARKSNAPNYSATQTSSIPLNPRMSAIALPDRLQRCHVAMFHHPKPKHRYLDRRARHGAADAVLIAPPSDRLVRLLHEGAGFFDVCTLALPYQRVGHGPRPPAAVGSLLEKSISSRHRPVPMPCMLITCACIGTPLAPLTLHYPIWSLCNGMGQIDRIRPRAPYV